MSKDKKQSAIIQKFGAKITPPLPLFFFLHFATTQMEENEILACFLADWAFFFSGT